MLCTRTINASGVPTRLSFLAFFARGLSNPWKDRFVLRRADEKDSDRASRWSWPSLLRTTFRISVVDPASSDDEMSSYSSQLEEEPPSSEEEIRSSFNDNDLPSGRGFS